MGGWLERAGQTHHRLPGNFLIINTSNKKVLVPLREQGQKIHFCGTTLFAGYSDRSARCQHTGCPLTLAMRQKILRPKPVPTALGGPFAAPLFAPFSATGTLCGCAAQLYSRFCGLTYVMLVIHEMCAFVKNFFTPQVDKLNIPAQRLSRCR